MSPGCFVFLTINFSCSATKKCFDCVYSCIPLPQFASACIHLKITVNKRDIILQIAEETGITQALTKEIVQATFDTIIEILGETGRLELRGFGVFEVKHRAAYTARNPLTGEAVKVPAKDVVVFQPGKAMAEKVQKRNQKKRVKRK